MKKCKCGQISCYHVQAGKSEALAFCETCMIDEITVSNKAYKVNRKSGVGIKGLTNGQGGYCGKMPQADA